MTKFGFVFPGQGSQKVGMGKDLYDRYDQVKAIFNKADEVLGRSISQVCFKRLIKEVDTKKILGCALTVLVNSS